MTSVNPFSPSQFSNLPPELRSQIWRRVLPETVEPMMIPYKKGCWHFRDVTESDDDYDPENFYGLYLMFRHELLDQVELDLPMFFVNREARGIARSWMNKQGLETQFYQNASQPLIVRRFDPLRDALYVPLYKWREFCEEPIYLPFEQIMGQTYSSGGRQLYNIAVPSYAFRTGPSQCTIGAMFEEVLHVCFCPAVLLVVVNAHTGLDPPDSEEKQQWMFESDRERALIWDLNEGRFNWHEGNEICDQELYMRIEAVANEEIAPTLIRDAFRSFEIRPILMAR